MGMGPGMGNNCGPGMNGPGRMIGMEFLMQDPEIRDLMIQIKVIDSINRIGLNQDQVTQIIQYGQQSQDIMNNEFSGLRDEIKTRLQEQLDSSIAGNESNPEAIRQFIEESTADTDPTEVKEQLDGILDSVIALLTDEQKETLMSMGQEEGGMRDRMRDRFQQFRGGDGEGSGGGWMNNGPGMGPENQPTPDNQEPNSELTPENEQNPDHIPFMDGPFAEWFQGLDQEQQDSFRQIIQDRQSGFRDEALKMKIMMMLMSPEATGAMQVWLDAQP